MPEIKLETDDTSDANNGLSHTADFDDTKYARPNYSDSRTVASTSKNIAYGGETISYANNSGSKAKSSGRQKVLLRYAVEKAGGTVDWDEKTGMAVANIDGNVMCYKGENINGRIVVDSDMLANDFGKDPSAFETNIETEFDRPQDAALAFGLTYRPHSDENQVEYGAIIVSKKVNGKKVYSYKNIVKSKPHPASKNYEDWKHGVEYDFNLARGEKLEATIHTHWHPESVEDFSKRDYMNTHPDINSMYVMLPDSRFLYSERTSNGFTKGVHIF
ncbi:MAG: hypothetical protein IJD83_06045 [Clostridia bacterium]|nr:hypothetical protein [Clostridia bacterium]